MRCKFSCQILWVFQTEPTALFSFKWQIWMQNEKPWFLFLAHAGGRVIFYYSKSSRTWRMLILASQECFPFSTHIKAICKPFIPNFWLLNIIALEMNIYFECQASFLCMAQMMFLNVCSGGAMQCHIVFFWKRPWTLKYVLHMIESLLLILPYFSLPP